MMMMQAGVTVASEDHGDDTTRSDAGVIVKREPVEQAADRASDDSSAPHDVWGQNVDVSDIKSTPSVPEKPSDVDAPKVSVIQQHTSKKPSTNRRKNAQQTPYKFHNWETPLDCTSTPGRDDLSTRLAASLTTSTPSVPKMCRFDVDATPVKKECPDPYHAIPPRLSLESLPNESIKNWLQRITAIQNEIMHKQQTQNCSTGDVASLVPVKETECKQRKQKVDTPIETVERSRVVSYRDLPYMGEMTLDNCKPRRGRKPKKADICHLIYKNYGTIVPGSPTTPLDVDPQSTGVPDKSSTDPVKDLSKIEPTEHVPRTDIQNRIISSLLERRLTQESKRKDGATASAIAAKPKSKTHQDEPLNLCIRDLNQLKIRLLRRHDNVYESQNQSGVVSPASSVKSEPRSDDDDDVEFLQEIKPSGSRTALTATTSSTGTVSSPEVSPVASDAIPDGFVFWPNAGVFVNPAALQTQMMQYGKKLAENSGGFLLPASSRPSSTSSGAETPRQQSDPTASCGDASVDEHRQQHHHQQQQQRRTEPKSKRTTGVRSTGAPPTKRKRSAIFIPPIPVENQNNPATEVSICKFKFTGGAKPCLQEKKMLSVDSGGNFRYYSGTGDKSMRGYEFFPRKVLQQHASNGHTSSSGVFLNASGEKISMSPPLDASGIIESRADPLRMVDSLVIRAAQQQQQQNQNQHHHPNAKQLAADDASTPPDATSARQRKRRTRKSLQREKLEQTFKEKGFLIQTQQLESAEGATYCKFRQLRKFTRYLFRSWKDYLPGNVRDMQAGVDAVDAGEHSDDELFATMPPSVPSSDVQERTPSV